jgi:peptidoglycan/LPS O-acetylase OafA/YrhL
MELVGWMRIPNLGAILNWTSQIIGSLGFAYVFFLLVEKPSHKLARKIKVLLAPRARTAQETLEVEGLQAKP